MQRAMLFIDFENFDIAKYNYYKKKSIADAEEAARIAGTTFPESVPVTNPRLDFNELPKKIVALLPEPHVLVKTFLFAPKPDQFLMTDPIPSPVLRRRNKTYTPYFSYPSTNCNSL